MSASYARHTTVTYSSAAVLCVALPLIVPGEHQPVAISVALCLGAPLAAVAVLLATLQVALGLETRSDWFVAAAFSVAAVLSVQPASYWWPAVGAGLGRLGLAAIAAASVALVRLALRTWRAPSRARHGLGIGVVLVAGRLAASAYQAAFNPSSGMEAVAESMSAFLLDTALAAVVLLLGLVGHWLLASGAKPARRLTGA